MNTIELILSREGENIRIRAAESPKHTLRPYEEKPVSFNTIDSLCTEMLSILNRANRRGEIAERLVNDLKKAGQDLFDELMTETVKKTLRDTSSSTLSLDTDDRLMHIPWELLFDGEAFLCRKFNLGRIISTKQNITGTQKRPLKESLKMLIIADPGENLAAAYREGIKIRDELTDRQDRLKVNLVSRKVDREFVRRNIRQYDIVHYTGHGEYDDENPAQSGWCMHDGTWTASEIKTIKGETPFPALVFSNACHSGRTQQRSVEKEIHDLASTFLQCGVTHYIGTFLEVLDTPGSTFALEFYRSLGKNMSVGEAVRNARERLIEHYGESNIIWASYMLYGDPAHTLFHKAPQAVQQSKKASSLAYAIAALLIVLVMYFGINALRGPNAVPDKTRSISASSLQEGLSISFLHMAGLLDGEPGQVRTILTGGSRMYMYDRFEFHMKSRRDPYIYLLTSSGPENTKLLLSQRSVHAGNDSDSEYMVPLEAHLLKPDETAATGFIYVLASEEEIEDRQQLLWEIEKLDEALNTIQHDPPEPYSKEREYRVIARLEVQNGRLLSITRPSQ